MIPFARISVTPGHALPSFTPEDIFKTSLLSNDVVNAPRIRILLRTCGHCNEWASKIKSQENQSFRLQHLSTSTPVGTHNTKPIPSVGRAQALERYLADPYPRHPHMPLRCLYANDAPRSWHADPIMFPDRGMEFHCKVEDLAEVEILDRDGAAVVRLRLELSSGCQSPGIWSGHSIEDCETLYVCVDRQLREAFALAPALPSAVDVMAELERVSLRNEDPLGSRSPFHDWEDAGRAWHREEVEGEGKREAGQAQRNLRRLCRMAIQSGEPSELWHFRAAGQGRLLGGLCRGLAAAVWASRTGTHFAKLPREVFDLILAHVDAPLIVP
ncbi:hypothetical protein BDK51DRAFT_51002 [Blyttiomyces helicus]|uniref:Uncharacterized protein n=1 Tax=Blyttiomyces helicus TaxID=388810 RepID=A0A4P9WH36_9FUNG|nr:hypothetical protein BDK51DRAFT_51002 [Blyttiomyces helicus]|eukprot:RKO91153.1 hypothetical protein BDK51DRAFT_51002 [Blyttiomyces helicus]